MQILIDISKKEYDLVQNGGGYNYLTAINNGTPIPDNATNGDVIKALFPDKLIWTGINEKYEEIGFCHNGKDIVFTTEWWNAPYKRGEIDG